MTTHPLIGTACEYQDWLDQGQDLHGDYTFVFIPSLLSNLLALETKLGRDALEAEVLAIRNQSGGLPIPNDQLNGYSDLDPLQCWSQWCLYKRDATAV